MAFRPAITVLIPVYNGADYLAEAVESALAQQYEDFEVLVVDDGSTDEGRTAQVATGFGAAIRYVRKENGGVATALNVGIEHARGEYVSWLSHDDAYLPHKLERQVAFLAGRDPDTVVYADFELIDAQSKVLGARHLAPLPEDAPLFGLMQASPVNGCTTLIRKRCLEDAGGFDTALRTTQDLDMWIRLARRYPFGHMPEIVLRSRQHPAQGTRALKGYHEEQVDRFFARYLEELPAPELFGPGRSPALGYLDLAASYARDQRRAAARLALQMARRHLQPAERRAFGARLTRMRLEAGVLAARNGVLAALGLANLDSGLKRRLYRLYHALRG